jgi:hypothetical protein
MDGTLDEIYGNNIYLEQKQNVGSIKIYMEVNNGDFSIIA